VRIVLSYIPFKREVAPNSTEEKLALSQNNSTGIGSEKGKKEGLYE
jgi:hypothetical protein